MDEGEDLPDGRARVISRLNALIQEGRCRARRWLSRVFLGFGLSGCGVARLIRASHHRSGCPGASATSCTGRAPRAAETMNRDPAARPCPWPGPSACPGSKPQPPPAQQSTIGTDDPLEPSRGVGRADLVQPLQRQGHPARWSGPLLWRGSVRSAESRRRNSMQPWPPRSNRTTGGGARWQRGFFTAWPTPDRRSRV